MDRLATDGVAVTLGRTVQHRSGGGPQAGWDAARRHIDRTRRPFSVSVLRSLFASSRRGEDGQGLAEYALILALIAIVAIIALIFLGGQVSTILSTVGSSV